MTEKPPPSLKDLDARLQKAESRQRSRKSAGKDTGRDSALSLAFRIGVELVAALIVGVGIGLLLDYWLGTKPWMFLLFFLLGSAAGILNVFRVMSGYGYAAGYTKTDSDPANTPPRDQTPGDKTQED